MTTRLKLSGKMRIVDIANEQDEVEFWHCPECGEVCDLQYDGAVPMRVCTSGDCSFNERLPTETNEDLYGKG